METVSNTATDKTKNKYDSKAFRDVLACDSKIPPLGGGITMQIR